MSTNPSAAPRKTGVSPETDALSSTLFGQGLDLLAEGSEVGVLLVLQDAHDNVTSLSFTGDGIEVELDAARQHVKSAGQDPNSQVMRYALIYVGAVEAQDGSFEDALLMEFGERGWCAYSAYSFFEGAGQGDAFRWTEPAPAGELKPLLLSAARLAELPFLSASLHQLKTNFAEKNPCIRGCLPRCRGFGLLASRGGVKLRRNSVNGSTF